MFSNALTKDTLNSDDVMQRFFVNARTDDNQYFECIPSKTTNLDIFCFCNPEISKTNAREIFDYYREKFIKAKLMGKKIGSFRTRLSDFVSEKHDFNPRNTNHLNRSQDYLIHDGNRLVKSTRTDEIKDLISVACYLELMYREDTVMESINTGITPWKQEKISQRILGTVPYNNYRSYFSKSASMPFDPTDYETRKITIKSHLDYAYKNTYKFICESEVGCVKLDVHRHHSPFLDKFIHQVKEGIEINVVTSEQKFSIDEENSYIDIKKFFLE